MHNIELSQFHLLILLAIIIHAHFRVLLSPFTKLHNLVNTLQLCVLKQSYTVALFSVFPCGQRKVK